MIFKGDIISGCEISDNKIQMPIDRKSLKNSRIHIANLAQNLKCHYKDHAILVYLVNL